MKRAYRERVYRCGNRYAEAEIYPVYRVQGSRGRRAKPTTEVQTKLNQRQAERKLSRLIKTNFDCGDYELHLTYAPENLPATEEEDRRNVTAFILRVRRYIDKHCEGRAGSELKYINVTEGGSNGKRWHHHMTISGIVSREKLEALWGLGYANCRSLQFDDDGIEGLVRYITKQSANDERAFGKKRWSCSRNLKKPEEDVREGKISHKAMVSAADEGPAAISRYYPGYRITDLRMIHNDVNGGYYLSVRMVKIKQNR